MFFLQRSKGVLVSVHVNGLYYSDEIGTICILHILAYSSNLV